MSDLGSAISARSVSEVIDRLRANARANEKAQLSPAAIAAAAATLPPALSPIVLAGFVRVAEFVIVAAVGLAIHAIYVLPSEGFGWHYGVATGAIALMSVVSFQAADIYQVQAFRGYEKQYMRLASAWSLVFLLLIGVSFFAKLGEQFSRVWLGSFYVAGLLALILFRRALFLLVRRWTEKGYLTLRTVIVGGGDAGASVINELKRQKNLGIQIIGVFDDRGDNRSGAEIAGEPKLGRVDDLVEFGRLTRVDLVIFALPVSAEGRILEMLKKLWVLPVDIRLAAHSAKLRFRPRSYSYIGKVPVIDVADRPIADWDVVMKWLFDKIVGVTALIALSPVMALTALAIKFDSRGPVLFKQKR